MLSKTTANTIAIIDSGIDSNNSNLMKNIIGGVTFENGELINGFYDENGHGTKCASIIMKHCKEAKFFIVKVLNKNLEGNSYDIIEALNYLKESNISIINLSLSTNNDFYKCDYEKVCKELKDNGKIIIASRDNHLDNISYPSSLDSVVGVQGNIYLDENEYWYNKTCKFQVVSSSVPKLTLSLDNQYEIFSGNSKACAVFTSIMYNHIAINKFDTNNIDASLCKSAIKKNWNHINNNISYILKDYHEINGNQEILDKIKYIIKETLELDSKRFELLEQFILFYGEVGLNCKNCFQLIQNLEKEFCININYEDVSFFDCISPNSLAKLILRSNNEGKTK